MDPVEEIVEMANKMLERVKKGEISMEYYSGWLMGMAQGLLVAQKVMRGK